MAKVIIAIHGLRNKPPKELLEQCFIKAIKEGFKSKGLKVNLPKFELVYWADVLYDKPLSPKEKNPKSPYYIDEPYRPALENRMVVSYPFRRKFYRLLKKIIYKLTLRKNYELRYPFLAKSFIHNNFRDLEIYFAENCEQFKSEDCISKEKIDKRLVDLLKKYKNDEILLIAHSMGSIIAFDVLSFVYPKTPIHTLVTMGSPLGAPFVVSRIAEYSKKYNNGKVKIQTPEVVYKNWYNFSDIRDNIAMDFVLSDDFAENSKGVKVIDKLVYNDYKIAKQINPHKSFGYLRTPEFIEVLKDFIEQKDIHRTRLSVMKKEIGKLIRVLKNKGTKNKNLRDK